MVVPPNTPKLSFLVGKPIVVGYHHFRKPLYIYIYNIPSAKGKILNINLSFAKLLKGCSKWSKQKDIGKPYLLTWPCGKCVTVFSSTPKLINGIITILPTFIADFWAHFEQHIRGSKYFWLSISSTDDFKCLLQRDTYWWWHFHCLTQKITSGQSTKPPTLYLELLVWWLEKNKIPQMVI